MQISPVLDVPCEHDLTAQQPNSRTCFVCGMENIAGLHVRFFNDGPQRARAQVTLDERFQSYPGVAHGGIIATLLDETIGRAPMSGDPNRFMFTAKMEIRYRQVVPLNVPLTVTSRLEKDRGRMAIGIGEIFLPDGTLAAEAIATLMPIPSEYLDKMAEAQEDWRVYP